MTPAAGEAILDGGHFRCAWRLLGRCSWLVMNFPRPLGQWLQRRFVEGLENTRATAVPLAEGPVLEPV